jgi:outer membrane protein W
MNKLFNLGQISVILPYFGIGYEQYYFMIHFNKQTRKLITELPSIISEFASLTPH